MAHFWQIEQSRNDNVLVLRLGDKGTETSFLSFSVSDASLWGEWAAMSSGHPGSLWWNWCSQELRLPVASPVTELFWKWIIQVTSQLQPHEKPWPKPRSGAISGFLIPETVINICINRVTANFFVNWFVLQFVCVCVTVNFKEICKHFFFHLFPIHYIFWIFTITIMN